MLKRINDWINKHLAGKFGYIFALLMTLMVIGGLFRYYSSANTSQPAQVLIGLNESLWPDNSEIAQISYNGLNDPQAIAATIKTKAQEDALDQACKTTYSEVNKSYQDNQTLNRLLTLQQLTCIHYQGAKFGENYWQLQGLDVLKLSQDKLVSLFQANGEDLRASIINSKDLTGVSLADLRNPQYYSDLSASKLESIRFFCSMYFVANKPSEYLTSSYEFDSALASATYEGCLLVNYFYNENTKF